MSTFEEFTKRMDSLATVHRKSLAFRFAKRLEYIYRKWRNEPLAFTRVEQVGTDVGDTVDVFHPCLHDMLEHMACGALTKEVLLKGKRINAYRVVRQHVINEQSKTTIQPCWI